MLDKSLFDRVVRLLLTHMTDLKDRRALIEMALRPSPVLTQIDWEGPARSFTIDLVNLLDRFGEIEAGRPALVALINEIKPSVGIEQQAETDTLINEILLLSSAPDKAAPPRKIPQPPNVYALPAYSGAGSLFTGRKDEFNLLDEWAQAGGPDPKPMLVLVAIGGMGESALAWRWVQDRAVPFEGGVFWYSFYEGGADMRDCVRHALAYVTQQQPDKLKGGSFDEQLSQLIEALKQTRTLLVLDGLERVLVAYHRWDAAQMQDDSIPEDRDHRDCTNPRDEQALCQLANAAPSRILITSRLFPNGLLEANIPLPGVRHEMLNGLSREDARNLWHDLKIKWDNEALLDRFFDQIGRHGLLLKVAAGAINNRTRRRGHFDTWYADLEGQFDFASKDVKTKRHHILEAAYTGLTQEGRDLLAQIATFGTAVRFDTLNVFNPFLPPKPEPIEEPAEEPYDLWDARYELENAESEEENALWQAQVEREETLLAEARSTYTAYQQALLAWGKSPPYHEAVQTFEDLLSELQRRGLLWWDSQIDLYDLHPVVRGYAYNDLSEDERRTRHNQTYSLFETQERGLSTDNALTLADLSRPIAMYQALIGAGRLGDASTLYGFRLYTPLVSNIGAYPKAYELLLPLFGNGLDQLPTLRSVEQQGYRLTNMANILYYMDRHDEAFLLQSLDIRFSLDHSGSDLRVTLINYGLLLIEKNLLVQALRVYEICRDLARIADKDGLAHSYHRLLEIYRDLGRWSDADAAYQALMDDPEYQTDDWKSSTQRNYAMSLFYRGASIGEVQEALNEAQRLATASHDVLELRVLAWLRGEVLLQAGVAIEAITSFQDAIAQGRQSGIRDNDVFGALARAYITQGKIQAALRIVQEGCDEYSAACVYQAAGQLEEAHQFALKAYTEAWAQGKPYVHRYHLERATALLQSLAMPIPDLPVWDEARYEKFAHEDEVRAYIEKVKAAKDSEANDDEEGKEE